MANGVIETYEEAARSIALNLQRFCDANKPFPLMIADAARDAGQRVLHLENDNRLLSERQRLDKAFCYDMVLLCGDAVRVANAALRIDWSQMNYGGPQPLPAFVKALEDYAASVKKS